MAERRADVHPPHRGAADDYDAPDADDYGDPGDYLEDDEDTEEAYRDGMVGAASADSEPDVFLDVPKLKVEEIYLEVDDLNAQVSLQASVLDLLRLHVGAEVSLGRVELDIKGVEAAAQLKVHLDKVAMIIFRVMKTIDANPQIMTELTRGLSQAATEVGRGAGGALGEVGAGAGRAAGEVGAGAGRAVGEVGEGAESAVESAGRELKDAAGGISQDAGDALDDVTEDDTRSSGDERRRRAGSRRERGRAERRPGERSPSSSGERPRPERQHERRVRPGPARGDSEARGPRRPRPE